MKYCFTYGYNLIPPCRRRLLLLAGIITIVFPGITTLSSSASPLIRSSLVNASGNSNKAIIPRFPAIADVPISGQITDEKGNPLPGVSIHVKGTTQGTSTDDKGRFKLSVPSNSTLVISYIGYQTREVKVGASNQVLNIELSSASSQLNQLVVVGYGTQKKSDVTGSVATLDEKRLEQLPSSNYGQALEGAIPGVVVTQNDGNAEGANESIIIRGRKSILATNFPLIVLDGIPYNGGYTDINPNDIASISVLKDASAAAIYGSRGSNGVILITTKKGSTGSPVISYDGLYGTQKFEDLPAVLSPEQFYQFKQTREPGSITSSEQAVYDSKIFPDWVKLATRTGTREQHTLSVRGGTKNVKYYVSGTYLGVQGIAVNDNFKRATARLNLEINITNWLTYGTNTTLAYDDRSGLPALFSGQDGAYTKDPLTSATDSVGNEAVTVNGYANPLEPTLAKNLDHTYDLFSTNYLLVKLPFVKGLSYRLNTGVEHSSQNVDTYWGRNTLIGFNTQGQLSTNNYVSNSTTVENIVDYDRTFGKHSIGFTGLYSYEGDNNQSYTLTAKGFPNDVLTYYQANVALSIQPAASYAETTLLSQMARLNYGYANKYLLTVTGRRDGFSGFGQNKKFGFFPSAALAWNITNEKFMTNNKMINYLKLRLSYGSNGNQAVSPYSTLPKLSDRSYVIGSTTAPGYVPTSLGNPNLGWETTNTGNIGLDFGLFKNRLQGTIDVYKSTTLNLLLPRKISSVEGVGSIDENIGKTGNKGVEFTVNSMNIETKNFTWSTDANLSFNRNKILDLYGNGQSDTLNHWFIGHPINVNFDLVYGGVWQTTDDLSKSPQPNVQPGYAKVKDLNGDGKIDGKDRTIIGSLEPSFMWGMGNTFKYKNISLYVFVNGVQGVTKENTLMIDNVYYGVLLNTTLKNWWTSTNPTNDYYANNEKANIYGVNFYQNASYIRIKDIVLSYNFSSKLVEHLKLGRLRVYAEALNLFTITKWKALDPELSSQTGEPLQKEYLIGLDVSL